MSSTTFRVRSVANYITLGRLVSSVLVVVFLSGSGVWRFLGGVLFAVASFSDIVDGYIARSRGEVTELGKLADPVADKILLVSGMIPLVGTGDIPSWLAVLALAREFAVTGLRSIAACKGVIVPADVMGKVKTVLYTVAIVALIFGVKSFGSLTLYIGVFVSVLSAVNYFARYIDLLRGEV